MIRLLIVFVASAVFCSAQTPDAEALKHGYGTNGLAADLPLAKSPPTNEPTAMDITFTNATQRIVIKNLEYEPFILRTNWVRQRAFVTINCASNNAVSSNVVEDIGVVSVVIPWHPVRLITNPPAWTSNSVWEGK